MTTQAEPAASQRIATRRARSRRTNYRLVTVVSIVLLLILLQVLIGAFGNPLFAATPLEIAYELYAMTIDGRLPVAFWESLQPFLAGYLIAAGLAVPLGVFLGRFRLFEAAAGIYVTAGYAMPLIALVPLYILWFGLGFEVKTAIIATLAFFPICINTWVGVKAVPKTLVEVGQSFVGSNAEILTKIVLPASVPYVMAGLRLGVGKAVIGMIVAEFFTAITGLGGIIINAANSYETAEMLAPIIVLMVFAVALTALIGWAERRIAPWHAEVTGQDA